MYERAWWMVLKLRVLWGAPTVKPDLVSSMVSFISGSIRTGIWR
jgi:hypothetical protein